MMLKLDGPLYQAGTWIYNLLMLNALWLIFSLPVVTIGASTSAVFYVANKWVRQEEVGVITGFWQAFRTNFLQATGLWLLLVLLFNVALFTMQNAWILGTWSQIVVILQLVVMVELIAVGLYLFCLISRYHMSARDALRSSFLMANRHLLTTIVLLAGLALIPYIVYYFGFTLFLVVSLYALVVAYLLRPIFSRYAE